MPAGIVMASLFSPATAGNCAGSGTPGLMELSSAEASAAVDMVGVALLMIGSQGIAEAGGKFPIEMVAALVMASPGTVLGRPGARSQNENK